MSEPEHLAPEAGEAVFEVRLSGMAYGGEAVGRLPEGRAVFVPFALPGELVRLRLVEQKRGYARAVLLEVLEPASQRISPRCAHFGACGGCHYQHLPYPDQLAWKAEILRDQLQRIGGLQDPPVSGAVASPEEYYYRNHVQFHLNAGGQLGFYQAQPSGQRRKGGPDGGEQVLAIRECHLPEPALNETWPRLQFDSPEGLERVGLRLGIEEEVQLVLEGSDPQPPALTVEELPVSAVHLSPAGEIVLAGSRSVTVAVLGRQFQVSAGSFFQANTAVAGRLVEHVLAALPVYCPLDRGTVVVEAYCGVGLFSAFLAGRVGRLVGIESSPAAAADFEANLDEFDNVELYEAPVELALPALGVKPDVVLADPPRAGISRPALDALLALEPPVLVYVSCDPATLGRDARRLAEAGYRLEQVTPFDMFPQTYHIESVSFWLKSERSES